jgi:DNA-binding NtrC family response regulator
MVTEGLFREDLFYRLNVIPVQLPALRERKEDIPLLVRHFLEKFAASSVPSRGSVTASQDALRQLMAYAWPGNVRQLENAVERAFALSAGRSQIEVADLPTEIQQAVEPPARSATTLPEQGLSLERFVAGVERELIEQALERTSGNKGRAASLLGMKRTTLVEKLKRINVK